MSSILKALKKLENEKTARRYDSLDIDAEILRSEDSARFSLVKIALMVGLVFLCGSAATYLYMKYATTSPATSSAVVRGSKPADSTTAVTDSHSQNSTNPMVSPQTGSAVPNDTRRHLNTDISPPPKQPHRHSEPMHTKVRTALPIASSKNKQPTVTDGQTRSPAASPPVTAVTTPLIKVNGISFQGGEAGNMAIVNGAPVTIGSIVEGARVEDIQKDQVQFSFGGKKFEVGLGKSNR